MAICRASVPTGRLGAVKVRIRVVALRSLTCTACTVAITSGTALRFIIDLEKGKPTCQLGKVLTVLHTLGIKIEMIPPAGSGKKGT